MSRTPEEIRAGRRVPASGRRAQNRSKTVRLRQRVTSDTVDILAVLAEVWGVSEDAAIQCAIGMSGTIDGHVVFSRLAARWKVSEGAAVVRVFATQKGVSSRGAGLSAGRRKARSPVA